MMNVPLIVFEGSTVTPEIVTLAPTRLNCIAKLSEFVGSIVDTVATFEARPIAKIGTCNAGSAGAIAVIEEKLPL
jgi:hypothetical protein